MAQRGFSHFIKQADEMMDSQCTPTETLPDRQTPQVIRLSRTVHLPQVQGKCSWRCLWRCFYFHLSFFSSLLLNACAFIYLFFLHSLFHLRIIFSNSDLCYVTRRSNSWSSCAAAWTVGALLVHVFTYVQETAACASSHQTLEEHSSCSKHMHVLIYTQDKWLHV